MKKLRDNLLSLRNLVKKIDLCIAQVGWRATLVGAGVADEVNSELK